NTRRSFYPAVVGIVTVCVVCVGLLALIQRDSTTAAALGGPRVSSGTNPTAPLAPTIATPAMAPGPMFYCFDYYAKGPNPCTYGPTDAKISIAVVGDSHAAHLIPALIDVANTHGWRLTTITGMNCDGGLSPACGFGQKGFDDLIKAKYDL